jgi:NAD(P)-dependent dehydrogenase (short-subunit alcohol dehydrogenase family)
VPTDINRQHRASRAWSNPGLPIDRVGRPWDIAEAVHDLASDAAAWLTGVRLPVDGDQMVRP